MLSQLGLPASNRDTLTLIHSTGEVLSLARRRESTNTETFTLCCLYHPHPPFSLPLFSQFHISLSLSLSLLLPLPCSAHSLCLSPPLKARFSLKLRPGLCHFFVVVVAVYLSICASSSSSPFSFQSSCQYSSLFICISNSLTPLHSYMVSAFLPSEATRDAEADDTLAVQCIHQCFDIV